jgi:hypothetical protein
MDETEGNELSFGEVSPCRFDSINYNNEKIDGTKSAIKEMVEKGPGAESAA